MALCTECEGRGMYLVDGSHNVLQKVVCETCNGTGEEK